MFDLLDITDLSTAIGTSVTANRLSPYVVSSGPDLLIHSDDSVETLLSSFGLPVGDQATFETEVVFLDLPISVSPLFERIAIGLVDTQGKGLFVQISADQLATAAAPENTKSVLAKSTLQSTSYTLRIIANQDTGVADVYFTKTSDIATIGQQFLFTTSLLSPPPTFSDGFFLSVVGRGVHPITVRVEALRLASTLLYPNKIPVAVIEDGSGRVDQPVLLDASNSYDPEGSYLTFAWTVVSVPSGSLVTAASLKPSERFHLPGSQDSKPYFIPDKPGIYVFSLTVNDGSLNSIPKQVSIQISSASLERGYIPDATPIFSILSSSWNMVEHRDIVKTAWSAAMQIAAADLTTLWQKDRDKSIASIQREVHRKWLDFSPRLSLEVEPVQVSSTVETAGGSGLISYLELSDGVGYGTNVFTSAGAAYQTRGIRAGDAFTVSSITGSCYVTSVIDENTLILSSIIPVGTGLSYTVGSKTTLYESGSASGAIVGSLIRIEGMSDAWLREVVHVDGDYIIMDEEVDTAETSLAWYLSGGIVTFPYDLPESMYLFYNDVLVWDADGVEVVTYVLGTRGQKYGFFTSVEYSAAVNPFLLRGIRLHKIPCHKDTRSIPYLQTIIVDPPDDDLLKEYQHYTVEDGETGTTKWIVFVTPYTLDTVPEDYFWAEYVYLDNKDAVYSNFGYKVGVEPSNAVIEELGLDYLSVVRGLLYSQMLGPSIQNLSAGLSIFCGIPFTETEVVVLKIEDLYTTTHGRITVQDSITGITKTYLYRRALGLADSPADSTREIAVGDTLPAFTALSKGVEVVDWISHALWWKSMGLQEVEKYFTFGVWIDVDINPTSDFATLLTACIDFINRMKPTYTRVLAALEKKLSDTISVVDAITFEVILALFTKADRDSRVGMFDEVYSNGSPAWKFGDGLPAGYADRAGVESSVMLIKTDETGGGGSLKFGSAFTFDEPGLVFNGTIPVGTKSVTAFDEDEADAGSGPIT